MREKIIKFSAWALFFFVGLNVLFYSVDYFNSSYYLWFEKDFMESDTFNSLQLVTHYIQIFLIRFFLLIAPIWGVFAWLNFKENNCKTAFVYLLMAVIFMSIFWQNYLPFEIFTRFYEMINGNTTGGSISYMKSSPMTGILNGILITLIVTALKYRNSKMFFKADRFASNFFKTITSVLLNLHYYVVFALCVGLISYVYSTSGTPWLLPGLSAAASSILMSGAFLAAGLFLLTLVVMVWGRIKYRFYLKRTWFVLPVLDIIFLAVFTFWAVARAIAYF